MAVWLVRAGKNGHSEDYVIDQNRAVIGWSHCGDFSRIDSRQTLSKLLAETYPDRSAKTISNWESQIWPFLKVMQVGDIIAVPLKSRPTIAFGRISAEYVYDPSAPFDSTHQRPVEKWIEIPRANIGKDLLSSMSALMTVCRIQKNDAEKRISALLNGSRAPVDYIRQETTGSEPEGETIDIETSIRDQIRARIIERYKGGDLSKLVAAVLRAQGFQTTVAPEGPDGGIDIFAAKGSLGFDSPRMVVQVKSTDGPTDVMTVRQLQGVMHQNNAENGLFVAWGGYKSSVKKEFARHHFQMRLWTGEDLIDGILENYESLDPEVQAEIPLRRVWMLNLTEE